MLADLEIINHRLDSAEKNIEHETLIKCKESLEKSSPLRALELTPDEEKTTRGFQFLSRKPLFILGNIDENEVVVVTVYEPDSERWESGFRKRREQR